MSLRARLTLFFVVIVVLPVAVATAYGWQTVARSSQRRVQAELEQARRSAMVAFGARADRAQQAMAALAHDPALLQAMATGDAARVQAVLRDQRVTDLLLAVTAPDGRVLGRAGDTSPGFLPGVGRAPLAIVLLGLVVVGVVATLLGSVLARLVSRPLGELARSMNRLGETLSSTHDLPKLLAVVLEAAVQARRAKAGSLLLLTADRTALVREATHGLTHRDPAERIPVGQGVAGTVAATGRAMVLASPAGNGGPEPTATTQVSVPVAAQGRVLGVLSLYDREDGEPFTLADAEALTAFAVQAAVAIENVRLHAEAERLSVTDPLNGAWNYRYFSRRFEQEIERSRRFGRVSGSVRDIDTFARYGEEFVLILPETHLEGGLAVAEKLRLATHRTPFCAEGADGGVRLTVSIGVACFPEHPTSPEELLWAADEALYEAKLQGRARVVTAGPRLLPLAARPGHAGGRAARVE